MFESHQSSKKDTSGTAKAVVASFNKLGLQFDESQVCLCMCFCVSGTYGSSRPDACTSHTAVCWAGMVLLLLTYVPFLSMCLLLFVC